MAAAVDAGMFFSARAIREHALTIVGNYNFKSTISNFFKNSPWVLWISFFVAASASGFTQLLFAVSHAAPLEVTIGAQDIVALQENGWVLSILKQRVIILPLLLPGFAVLYTIAIKVNPASFDKADEQIPHKIPGNERIALRAFARMVGLSPETIRRRAQAGEIGSKNQQGHWVFGQDDLNTLFGS